MSDRWPQFALPAIVVAFAVVIGEATLFYMLSRKVAACALKTKKHDETKITVEITPVVAESLEALRREYEELAIRHRQYAFYVQRHHRHYALRPRASRASTWALAALRDDQALYPGLSKDIEIRLARQSELGQQLNPELAKWKIITHNDDSFNIVAGAFEIEYFHGLTNIRVLDTSRVTVEGEKRGLKSELIPSEISAASYQ